MEGCEVRADGEVIATACSPAMARRIRELLIAMHGVRITDACAPGEYGHLVRKADALASAVYQLFAYGSTPSLPSLQGSVQNLRAPVQAFTWARASLDTSGRPLERDVKRKK